MRGVLFALLIVVVIVGGDEFSVAGQTSKDKIKDPPKEAPKSTGKETPSDITRTKLLKTKVTRSFKDERLGDILKEFADQVDAKGDQPVMWSYGTGFPFAQRITFACKDKPLDVVLDQLLTKAGGGLGYVVVSKEGDKYDGWVRLTTTGERGVDKDAPSPAKVDEEASAAEKLALAKKLIDLGKPTAAKPVLEILVKNYPNTKAGAEAKELLEKLDK
ncbi:MAG TPA: hypothetical protein VG122_18145 [Gemmata sp.]|jgi:hypothetical protein|nr:hypothetical protein [Gemmata sp.]